MPQQYTGDRRPGWRQRLAGAAGRWRRFAGAALALLALACSPAGAETEVRVGVLAFRPAADVQAHWQPLIDYLNQRVPGYRFRAEALGYADLETAIAGRSIEFVLTNPGHYVLMTRRNGLSSPLATLVPIEQGRPVAKFGGVIFARADRQDIQGLDDLRGKTIAAVSRGSLGGYQAQAMELLQLGIRVPHDTRLLETDMPHDLAVSAVLAGRADAGFARTGVLEAMVREGKLDLSRLKILNPQQVPDFPFLLSTQLYPEWPFAAMPGVSEDLVRQVAAALLAVPHDSDMAHRLDIHGFTIPAEYESVRATLEALRLPPFDTAPHFTLEDIWRQYRWQLIAGLALSVVILLLTGLLTVANGRLAAERRRIARNAEEWHRLLAALGEGVYGIDEHGRCTFINPAALAQLGFAADEVLGQDQHALFHHHREDGGAYPAADCPIALTLIDGKTRQTEEWLLRKDGSGFPVMLTATAVTAEDARPGVVVVFRDITERRQAEETVQKLNAELERRVAQRTAQLAAANDELEEFSYSMSHDLRTPLRAIHGYSQILLEEHADQLDAEAKRLQARVRDAATRMGQLIDDILHFLDMRKRRLAPGRIDMGGLAQGVFDQIRGAGGSVPRMRLELGALPPAWGDREMIRQVLWHLLANSAKFASPDREALIEVGGTAGAAENAYFVRDNGIGFDMRFEEKLFKVFERLHPTGQYEGTAIGLAIVKRIVERHGGRVWAEGRVGEGATFHFTLPNGGD